jgi:glycosyltransferase involved in cell wall biosynthesis
MKLSFLITVHNETDSLRHLLDQLWQYQGHDPECEVIVLDDHSDNEETVSILKNYTNDGLIKVEQHSLNRNFGEHKQYGNTKCSGDYIFQIDSDELFSEDLLWNLKTLVESNPEVDLFMIPRVNTLEGMTQEHIMRWGWRVSMLNDVAKPMINWPDYQFRFYKNSPNIKWERPLHELVVGAEKVTYLPIEDATWALFHPKTIEQQEKQNMFYNTNFSRELNVRK